MPKGARLKRVIILPFFLILSAGFALMWLMYLNGSRAALRDAISSIIRESSERISEEILRRLDLASFAATSNAAFLASFPPSGQSSSAIRKIFAAQLSMDPSIAIFAVGTEEGEYLEAQRLETGDLRVGEAGKSTGGDLVFRPVLSDGSFGSETSRKVGYDPRKRPWYLAAIVADGPTWSSPYALYSNADLAIAAIAPIRSSGRVTGVTSATITLGTLSTYLSAMKEAANGLMYVADAEGRLLASSNASILSLSGDRAFPLESPDPLVVATAQAVVKAVSATVVPLALSGSGTDSGDASIFSFKLDKIAYLGRSVHFSPMPGLDWTIVLAVEERSYADKLLKIYLQNFILLAVFLGVSVFVGLFVVNYVTKPIRALADSVDALEPGVLVPAELSAFSGRNNELGRLSRSFLAMKLRLDESFSSIEASLTEKEMLLKEVHHRVKNNLQIVSSILSIQSGTLTDEAAKSAFDECQSRIQAMALVHEEVYRTGSFVELAMAGYLQRIAESLRHGWTKGSCQISMVLDVEESAALSMDKAIPCGLIVNELLTNALKHAFIGKTNGTVSIAFHPASGICRLSISDNGIGFNGTSLKADGIGTQLVQGLVGQLAGSIRYSTPADGGTIVSVEFPC